MWFYCSFSSSSRARRSRYKEVCETDPELRVLTTLCVFDFHDRMWAQQPIFLLLINTSAHRGMLLAVAVNTQQWRVSI